MAERIPVTVLTGFLGSGKTTVLNQLVSQPEFADTLVVINEFGQVALDHWLVAHSTENAVIEMGNGCVCCTIRTDLARTLRDITWRFARQGQRQFRRVWIETTGLANPIPIVQTLLSHPQVAPRYVLDGVVTVVDLVNAQSTLATYVEAGEQVAVADLLLLTKADRVDATQLAELSATLRQRNPSARQQVVTPRGLSAADVQCLEPQAPPPQGQAPSSGWRGEARAHVSLPVASDHPHQHPVDVNRHGASIRAHVFQFVQPIAAAALQDWLAELEEWAGPDLLRFKGVVRVAGQGTPLVVHAVQHTVAAPVALPAWPRGMVGSSLVFITRDLDRATLAARLATLGVAPVAVSHNGEAPGT